LTGRMGIATSVVSSSVSATTGNWAEEVLGKWSTRSLNATEAVIAYAICMLRTFHVIEKRGNLQLALSEEGMDARRLRFPKQKRNRYEAKTDGDGEPPVLSPEQPLLVLRVSWWVG
jgi:hypothetical protein